MSAQLPQGIVSQIAPIELPVFENLVTHYDPETRALWYYLNPQGRACFTPGLLRDIRALQTIVQTHLSRPEPEARDSIRYLVAASAVKDVFNRGGDLALFAQAIESGNRAMLAEYGRTCIDCVWHNHTSLGIPTLQTISIVQGQAYGGGFEAAISSNTIIAEESARFRFPEVMFALFPGMGAFSMLSRSIGGGPAERLINTGDEYTSRQLYDIGAIHEVVQDGEGVKAVQNFIRRHSRAAPGLLAMRQVRQRVQTLEYSELMDVLNVWVDTAMKLSRRDLKLMQAFAARQEKQMKQPETRETSQVLPFPAVLPLGGAQVFAH